MITGTPTGRPTVSAYGVHCIVENYPSTLSGSSPQSESTMQLYFARHCTAARHRETEKGLPGMRGAAATFIHHSQKSCQCMINITHIEQNPSHEKMGVVDHSVYSFQRFYSVF